MSWRCIDVEATLYLRHVPAGIDYMSTEYILVLNQIDFSSEINAFVV